MSSNAHYWRSRLSLLVAIPLTLLSFAVGGVLTIPTIHAAAAQGVIDSSVPAGYVVNANAKFPSGVPQGKGPIYTKANCVQPPSQTPPNLRHDQLSDAQIAQYDLLPRGHLAAAEWSEIVDTSTHNACNLYPTSLSFGKYESSGVKPLNEHTASTQNWSGYEQWGNSTIGENWDTTDSLWNVQTLENFADYYGEVADWVGEGGGPGVGGELVQTGVDMYEVSYVDRYWAWTENYPADSASEVFGVSPGDEIYAEVDDPNCMYIHDYGNGDSTPGDVCYGPTANEHGSECIRESSLGTPYTAIPDATTVYFTACQGYADTWDEYIGVGCNTCDGYDDITMANEYVDYYPSSPPDGSGDFSIYYSHSF